MMSDIDGLLYALEPIVSRVRTDITGAKVDGRSVWLRNEGLTKKRLREHLSGGVMRGACPIREGESTTRLALFDLDSHKGQTSWDEMVRVAIKFVKRLHEDGVYAHPYRSSGGNGIHLLMIWEDDQDAYSVRKYLATVLHSQGYSDGTKGVAAGQVEIFPKQDSVAHGDCGNYFILPLAGKSVPLHQKTLKIMKRADAESLDWYPSDSIAKIQRPKSDNINKTRTEPLNLDVVREQLSYIDPECDRKAWLSVGMALHFETYGDIAGLELWDEWSSGDLQKDGNNGVANYQDYEDLENQWKSFKIKKDRIVSARTIVKMARAAGWGRLSAEDEFADFGDEIRPRFYAHVVSDFISGPDPKFLIDNVLPESGLAMIAGKSGAGKSFLAIDIVCAIALGAAWREMPAVQKNVVYIAAEGAAGLRKRLRAYMHHHGVRFNDSLKIIADAPNFLTADHLELANAIQDCGGAGVVVIDTLAQVTPGADENSSTDMGKALGNVLAMQRSIGGLVIIVHHLGKDDSRGARGWSGLKAAMDTEIQIHEAKGIRTAKITKQKDGEEGKVYSFKLLPLTLIGADLDDEITSCVVDHIPDNAVRSQPKIGGRRQQAIYRAYEILRLDGETFFEEEALIEEAIKTSASKDDAHGRDRARESIIRALRGMVGSIFQRRGNLIGIPQPHISHN